MDFNIVLKMCIEKYGVGACCRDGKYLLENTGVDVTAFVEQEYETYYLKFKKNEKTNEINKAFENEMKLIAGLYPETEKLSWDKQEQEARAYLLDSNAQTPLLDSIAQARGVPKDVLAQKIVEKADAYSVAVGQAIGKRQALEDAINAATTLEELEAVKW